MYAIKQMIKEHVKVDLDFILVSATLLLGTGMFVCHFILSGSIFSAIFCVMFIYYVLQLYAINHFNLD